MWCCLLNKYSTTVCLCLSCKSTNWSAGCRRKTLGGTTAYGCSKNWWIHIDVSSSRLMYTVFQLVLFSIPFNSRNLLTITVSSMVKDSGCKYLSFRLSGRGVLFGSLHYTFKNLLRKYLLPQLYYQPCTPHLDSFNHCISFSIDTQVSFKSGPVSWLQTSSTVPPPHFHITNH